MNKNNSSYIIDSKNIQLNIDNSKSIEELSNNILNKEAIYTQELLQINKILKETLNHKILNEGFSKLVKYYVYELNKISNKSEDEIIKELFNCIKNDKEIRTEYYLLEQKYKELKAQYDNMYNNNICLKNNLQSLEFESSNNANELKLINNDLSQNNNIILKDINKFHETINYYYNFIKKVSFTLSNISEKIINNINTTKLINFSNIENIIEISSLEYKNVSFNYNNNNIEFDFNNIIIHIKKLTKTLLNEINSIKNINNNLSNNLEDLKTKNNKLVEQNNNLDITFDNYNKELTILNNKIINKESIILTKDNYIKKIKTDLNEDLKLLKKENFELQEYIKNIELTNKNEINVIKDQLDNKILLLINEKKNLEKKISIYKNEYNENIIKEKTKLEEKLKTQEYSIKEKDQQLENNKAIISNLKTTINDNNSQLKILNKLIEDLNKNNKNILNKQNEYKENVANLEKININYHLDKDFNNEIINCLILIIEGYFYEVLNLRSIYYIYVNYFRNYNNKKDDNYLFNVFKKLYFDANLVFNETDKLRLINLDKYINNSDKKDVLTNNHIFAKLKDVRELIYNSSISNKSNNLDLINNININYQVNNNIDNFYNRIDKGAILASLKSWTNDLCNSVCNEKNSNIKDKENEYIIYLKNLLDENKKELNKFKLNEENLHKINRQLKLEYSQVLSNNQLSDLNKNNYTKKIEELKQSKFNLINEIIMLRNYSYNNKILVNSNIENSFQFEKSKIIKNNFLINEKNKIYEDIIERKFFFVYYLFLDNLHIFIDNPSILNNTSKIFKSIIYYEKEYFNYSIDLIQLKSNYLHSNPNNNEAVNSEEIDKLQNYISKNFINIFIFNLI